MCIVLAHACLDYCTFVPLHSEYMFNSMLNFFTINVCAAYEGWVPMILGAGAADPKPR